MTKKTPSLTSLGTNLLAIVPELETQALTTIRLHPRRGEVLDVSASKIGGTFLWPANETWPKNDYINALYIPILQINLADVLNFPFPVGKDLMQFLWAPIPAYHKDSHLLCFPLIYWRSSELIHYSHTQIPQFNPDKHLIPKPCTLSFEKLIEYTPYEELTNEQTQRLVEGLDMERIRTLYHENDWLDTPNEYLTPYGVYTCLLSVCPASKLGGHVSWLQQPEWPTCDCGNRMDHLFTLTDSEIDRSTALRWLPVEDRETWKDLRTRNEIEIPPDWNLGGGAYYVFVCRLCSDWPIKGVYQR